MAEDNPLALQAEAAIKRRAAVISGNVWQPKLVWTLSPFSPNELRSLVTADGHSPLDYITSIQLGRDALQWAGAPHWAQYVYLVLVEVKATFVPGQR